MNNDLEQARTIIANGKHVMAFTGAGISVESGIPPFRGENSIWNKYDSQNLDIDFFMSHPERSWPVIKEIFYNFMDGGAKPNAAHLALAQMEAEGRLECVVTQNIDDLHQQAGSKKVYEFHGTARRVVCTKCSYVSPVREADISAEVPRCPHCGALLKPDFVFFGESIPMAAYQKSFDAAEIADVCIIVGSTGEVMPACLVPLKAKQHGAKIIEINPTDSEFTHKITDIHLKGKAGDIFKQLYSHV